MVAKTTMPLPKRDREPLTQRQRDVLAALRDLLRASGTPPTVRELRDHLRLRAVGAVQDHLAELERKGYLIRRRGAARGLIPVDEPAPGRLVPIVGRVPAGSPVLVLDEYIDGWLLVGESLPTGAALFALRVKGDSMVDAGILDGDVVIVRQQPDAEAGDIVLAMLEAEATVKRLACREGRLFLDAANPSHEPIPFEEKPGGVCGKVVAVWRLLP